MIKEKALKHGIRLKIDLDGIPETIQADERKLKQIMYNLLSNAAKFTPDSGNIWIVAKLVEEDEIRGPNLERPNALNRCSSIPASDQHFTKQAKESLLEVSVFDNGIGLKHDELKRIFETFEQVESTRSRKYQGTGLGLALTRQLVELHRGRIWAESEGEGKGSRFCFVLPIRNTQIENWR
jgi:signal transduction histidine kinase